MLRISLAVAGVLLISVPGSPGSADDRPQTRRAQPPRTTAPPASPPRYPWESARDTRERQKLSRIVKELILDRSTLEGVVAYLREVTGANIVVNWTALEFADIERTAEVSLQLTDVILEEALSIVLEKLGGGEVELASELAKGVLRISTKEDLSRNTIRQVYDCEDILHVDEQVLAAHVERVLKTIEARNQREVARDPETIERILRSAMVGLYDDAAQRLIDVIQDTVEPEAWRSTGGNVGSAQIFGHRLIIVQTVTAQQGVADLLAELRKPGAKRKAVGRVP